MTLPQTFKAFSAEKQGEPFSKIQRPLQLPKEGQVLVKVLACGVCHSDNGAKFGMGGFPRIPGHEIIGDVVAVPESEKTWKIGDRVGGGWHGGHCGHCRSCRSGNFITCEKENINGISMDGGYAEYVLLNTEAVVSIPSDLDPAEAAPLLCAGVTTFNSLRNMNLHPGEIVAVQGIGGLGHLTIQYANKMGYRTVALSSSSSKKDLAINLGAHDYLDGSKVDQAEELAKMGGAKVVVATAPNADIISSLIGGMAPNGTLLLLAISEGIKLNSGPLVRKSLSIRGWPSGTAKDSEDTVAFTKLTGIKCHVEKYPLDEVNTAFDIMMSGKAKFRCVIIP